MGLNRSLTVQRKSVGTRHKSIERPDALEAFVNKENRALVRPDTGDPSYEIVSLMVAAINQISRPDLRTSRWLHHVLGEQSIEPDFGSNNLVDKADHGKDVLVFLLAGELRHRSDHFQATLRIRKPHDPVEPIDRSTRHGMVPLILTSCDMCRDYWPI